MTNATHTPGPWELSEYRPQYDDVGGDYSVGYKDADGVFWDIATLEPWRGSRHADGLLIAAAPEMLAALEEALEVLGELEPEERWPGLDNVERNWRFVIAKAKGLNQ